MKPKKPVPVIILCLVFTGLAPAFYHLKLAEQSPVKASLVVEKPREERPAFPLWALEDLKTATETSLTASGTIVF